MNSSFFPSFKSEKNLYKLKVKKMLLDENSGVHLKQACKTILEYPYVLDQLVLFGRQRKINRILRDIVKIINVDVKRNDAILRNDIPSIFTIFQKYGLSYSFEELSIFKTIEDIRVFLYDLAGILCTPLDRVYEAGEQLMIDEINLLQYVGILYEAGVSFGGENNDLIFDSPRIFRFSQYIDCIFRKDFHLISMEFYVSKK